MTQNIDFIKIHDFSMKLFSYGLECQNKRKKYLTSP